MANISFTTLVVCILTISMSGCDKDAEESVVAQNLSVNATEDMTGSAAGDTDVETPEWTESTELDLSAGTGTTEIDDSLAAVLDPSEIPYPLYPNGSRYRIGGEGDLKIVLFQTEDSFNEVDAYYQEEAGLLPRLIAMSDYVRYSIDNSDIDPWETSRPGIVIHQFNDESEREAVGAENTARTNIIMSYE